MAPTRIEKKEDRSFACLSAGRRREKQRELRRAIHHLGERRAAELGINNALDGPGNAFDSSSPHARAHAESTIGVPPFGPSVPQWVSM
jgi:hypothetical protein